MVKKVNFSLFAKLFIGISITIVIFGFINIIIVRNSVSESLHDEFNRRGYFISRTLAEQSVRYILSDNLTGLNLLVNEVMAIDPTVYYAFITDDKQEIIAHSFNQKVPQSLVFANIIHPEDTLKTVMIRDVDNKNILIKDFAMPILTHNIGIVRVGILEKEISRKLSQTLAILWWMIGVFLFFGLLGALFFFYTIAFPLRVLSEQSEGIDIKTIQDGLSKLSESTKKKYFKIRKIFNTTDEIDVLYNSYASMLERLEQTHEKLNLLQQSLMQSEKMAAIGTLTAGVAHEINNPITGIRNCLERIDKRPEDIEQIKKYVELMQQATARIEHVVKDLLTFGRNSYQEIKEINICEPVKKAIKLAQYRTKKHNIDLQVDRSVYPYKINAAANYIEQVFLNIITNAIDAILNKKEVQSEHKGVIKVSIEESDHSSTIVFMDNGCGMDKVVMSKIFDPFFTTKKVGEGTGLGLHISYRIVKDHGGDILVESVPGEYTIFKVVFPKTK